MAFHGIHIKPENKGKLHAELGVPKGEKLTEVPGIEIPEPVPSVPRVSLERDATEIIAAAWPQIQGSLREVLALPPGEVP